MPQTIQGADLLAESLKAVVLVPDFFKGEPLPLSIYPPNTEEKKKMAGEFIAGTAGMCSPAKYFPIGSIFWSRETCFGSKCFSKMSHDSNFDLEKEMLTWRSS